MYVAKPSRENETDKRHCYSLFLADCTMPQLFPFPALFLENNLNSAKNEVSDKQDTPNTTFGRKLGDTRKAVK